MYVWSAAHLVIEAESAFHLRLLLFERLSARNDSTLIARPRTNLSHTYSTYS